MLAERHKALTIPEVAALLQVSRSTIYKLIEGGDLRPVKIGKAVRFFQDDIDRYLSLLRARR